MKQTQELLYSAYVSVNV